MQQGESKNKNPLLNKYTNFSSLAPSTFLMLISFNRVSVVNTTIPNNPIDAMLIARNARKPITLIITEN